MIVLALTVDGAQDLAANVDGVDGTLPSFTPDYASCATAAAAALMEADPCADVSIEVRDVEYDWTAIDALGQAVEGLQLVLLVASAWRMRRALDPVA